MSPTITIISALLAVAFFAGVETAFLSADRLQIELKKQQGSQRGHILSRFYTNESEFIVTMLIGNAIILVLIGKEMDDLLKHFLADYALAEWAQILITTSITTAIVLFFAEFLPKALFLINPSGILFYLAYPIHYVLLLLRPLTWFFLWLSKKILSVFITLKSDATVLNFSRKDLLNFIETTNSEKSEVDTNLIKNTIELANSRVSQCMVPRLDIDWHDINDGIEVLKAMFIETQHSKIIIGNGSIDEPLGYIHHHQLLADPNDLSPLLMPLPEVPGVMPTVEVMNLFIKQKKSIAVVFDEFGGTSGIVTLEDILEEIFGEINDEYDTPEHLEEEIHPNNEYRFSGRLEMDYLNEKYNLNLPADDYNNLSGYIIQTAESIPKQGETIRLGSFDYLIEQVSDTRVEEVRIIRVVNE